ncbi:hypothetical protein GAY27_20755 [Azospirillum brasilense]|nr:hypothetical protein [Azospirillum brasilense]
MSSSQLCRRSADLDTIRRYRWKGCIGGGGGGGGRGGGGGPPPPPTNGRVCVGKGGSRGAHPRPHKKQGGRRGFFSVGGRSSCFFYCFAVFVVG